MVLRGGIRESACSGKLVMTAALDSIGGAWKVLD
jgi:hypothetical protein